MTLDGFVVGPNGELDWINTYPCRWHKYPEGLIGIYWKVGKPSSKCRTFGEEKTLQN
jgi:hypothetical protein